MSTTDQLIYTIIHIQYRFALTIIMITPRNVLLTKASIYANYTKFNPQESNLLVEKKKIITTQTE